MQVFPAAPMDRPARIVTFGVATLMFLAGPALTFTGADTRAEQVVTGAVVGALFAILLVVAWSLGPGAFELDRSTLRIRRRGPGMKQYTITGPVRRAPATLGLGSRLGGSGGVFGWYGAFRNPEIGRYRAYVTDRARIVAVPTEDGLVVVSPVDPDAFMRAARRKR